MSTEEDNLLDVNAGAALLDDEDLNLLRNAPDEATTGEDQSQQQQLLDDEAAAAPTGEEQQQQQQASFVWVQMQGSTEGLEEGAEAPLVWLPAVYCGQNEDGTFAVAFASDLNQAYAVAHCEEITDMSDARFADPEATEQYNLLYNTYYGDAKAAEKQRKKEQKRLEKEAKRAEKKAKKEAKKANKRGGDDDDAAESSSAEESDEDDDDNNNASGAFDGAVDRMRRGGGGYAAAAAAAAANVGPRTALDFAVAGSTDKMKNFLTKARDDYEAARQKAIENGERMVEFESDYLNRIKQSRIEQLSILRFLNGRMGKKELQDQEKANGSNFIQELEAGKIAHGVNPQSRRIEMPDRFDRVPRAFGNNNNNGDDQYQRGGAQQVGSSQFVDPLLRQVSPPRFEVERLPLALRTFTDTASSTATDANIIRFYTKNPPMKQWRAKRDLFVQTPPDIVQVPPSGHIPRRFNEPRDKLEKKTMQMTQKILGADAAIGGDIDDPSNRQCNTQFTLFDYVGTQFFQQVPNYFKILEQQRHQGGLPSVGPSPRHLGERTPAFSEVYGGGATGGNRSAVPSAAPSEIGASQIPVYEDDDLGFHVDPQSKSMSRARSQQSQQSAISNDTSLGGGDNNNNNNKNNSENGSQPRSAHEQQQLQAGANQTTWKKCAARVISRVLTPYLHGTHGCPMLITDDDDFTTLSRELTTKAYNSKLKMLGLAPELKHAPIPESEFSDQDAAMLAAAVQNYMKGRRRRGRSDSGSQQGSNAGSGTSSGTGTSYTGPGGSSVGSQGSGSRSFYSSSSASSYTSGAGSRSDYTSSAGGLTPYSTASQPEGGNRGYTNNNNNNNNQNRQ